MSCQEAVLSPAPTAQPVWMRIKMPGTLPHLLLQGPEELEQGLGSSYTAGANGL